MYSPFRLLLGVVLLASCLAAQSAPVDNAILLIHNNKFSEALSALKQDQSPSAKASGVMCYLYAWNYVAYDAEVAPKVCVTAVTAKDPIGLVSAAFLELEKNPPAGFSSDETLALGKLAEATKQDYYPAYGALCRYFYNKQRYTDASPYCKTAAAHHWPIAVFLLGEMFLSGDGTVQDYKKAVALFTMAAKQGFSPAYKQLGDLSSVGRAGVKKDLVQAYAWYLLASSGSEIPADIQRQRDALDLSEAQISKAQTLAGKWQTVPAPELF